ncbi:MAG: IS1634 family transposase [Actinobacteria bacterium]|nr:IS1634 family transposase [Actinomycetota bacterium]MCA1697946.1 IS1634 family transposase [Actinomycetota bacterium]
MYLRRTQRRRKDGSAVGYVQLAHNRRVGGVTRAEVLLNLGREDELDVEGLRRLARSIARYTDGEAPDAGEAAGEGLEVISSRPLGGALVLDALWRRLGVADAVASGVDARRFQTDVERVLFALVANRALKPFSKLAAAEWASCDVHISGLEEVDEDEAYRAMDVLAAADTQARVQEAVFFAVADLLNLEVDLLFFDTTSTYFERDEPEVGADGEPGFRTLGHSKDHRPDLPQVVIGLAVTREGIPVRVWVWPGNTNDQSVIEEVKDDLAGWRLGRCVWVVDRGFSSDENLRYLTRAGGHWIAGEKMRDGSPDARAALARPGRYRSVRDNLRVKEVKLDDGAAEGEAKRFVVCHNPSEAERDRQERDEQLARIESELARIEALRERARRQRKNKAQATSTARKARQAKTKKTLARNQDKAHVKTECALRDHPTLGRYVRLTPTGRLRIDRAKVAAEKRLDGKFLLSTSDPEISAEDVALGYKNLLQAERSFRDLKGILALRPIFHRLEQRIRAHILICWLALLLVRLCERQTGDAWRNLRRELERIHLVTLAGSAGQVQQSTRLTPAQRNILAQLGIEPPPRLTSLTPAS